MSRPPVPHHWPNVPIVICRGPGVPYLVLFERTPRLIAQGSFVIALQTHLLAIQEQGFQTTRPAHGSGAESWDRSLVRSRAGDRQTRNRDPTMPAFPRFNEDPIRALGIFLGAEADSEATRPNRTMHGRPPTIGRQLSSADKVFPHKVKRVLEAGMLEYIPLDLLTDDACRRAAREPPAPESAFVISNGKLRLPNASFNVLKESKLSFDEWVGAGANLVAAMRKHLRAEGDQGVGGPFALEIADSFEGHFKYLKNLPDAKVQFEVVFDYNRRLRSLFVLDSHTFRMDDFHSHVWQECLNQQHAARVAHLDTRLAQMESFLPRQKDKDVTSNNSFPGSGSTHRTTKCIACGASDHKLIACRRDATFLRKDGRVWKTPAGASVCFGFNSFASCSRGTACTHVHVCSLCGSSAHGAQACAA